MELPPAPRPDAAGAAPATGTPRGAGRRLVLAAAIGLAAAGAVLLFAFLAGGGDELPATALGYERLDNDAADRAESMLESFRFGDIEIRAAVYGEGEQPRLVAAIYEHYPAGAQVEAIIEGAAAGAEASGGTVDRSSLQVSESGGYRFACMRGEGPGFLVPGGPSERGVMCVFAGGSVGLLVTTHTTEPVLGLMDARAFVDALEAA